ncbi:hypothetical protein SKAU_G00316210 [Synaphobranchus kaupii]|uniref:Uncharacterized protein n=1 Tax=Synaphobranchus kaupii TaxID=118154 RepID=A0A9Q1ILR1_SYNKA|nr:hypothetical protein SKAU_G00316210 [Synaphobranchus kaupii]
MVDVEGVGERSFKLNGHVTLPEKLDGPVIDVEDERSPQSESCANSGAENEGSCHSDQMSNDFYTDDCVKLFCMHPEKAVMVECKLEVHKDKTLRDTMEIAYKVTELCAEIMRVVLERCYNGLWLLYVTNKMRKLRASSEAIRTAASTHLSLTRLPPSPPLSKTRLPLLLAVETAGSNGNTIRLFVSLPEQASGCLANRTTGQKASCDPEDLPGGSKGNRRARRDLKTLSLQQQQNRTPSEEYTDPEANNVRCTSSVDSDILSSSHGSDTLCNANSGLTTLVKAWTQHHQQQAFSLPQGQ